MFKLLLCSYKFLEAFCMYNEENQSLLVADIGLFMDELNEDFGQLDLICAIF
jgi:hypothetical protein